MLYASLTLSGANESGYAMFDCENGNAIADLVLNGFKQIGKAGAVINEGDLFVSVLIKDGKAMMTHGNNKTISRIKKIPKLYYCINYSKWYKYGSRDIKSYHGRLW